LKYAQNNATTPWFPLLDRVCERERERERERGVLKKEKKMGFPRESERERG